MTTSASGTTGAGRFAGRQRPALALLAAVQFMLVLDGAIVSVAAPSIQRELGVSATELPWVFNGYAVVFGGFLLVGGRLGDLLGARRVLVGGAAIFSLASLLGGLTTSVPAVIASRALQGLAGAAISPALLVLLIEVFPDGDSSAKVRRNRAFGVFGAAAAAGGSAGYFLGGVLTSAFGWRSVFLVNVPCGVAAFVLARRMLPAGRRLPGTGGLDFAGAATMTGGMALLVYAILEAGSGGIASGRTLVPAACATVLIGGFAVIQRVRAHPLVPLSVLRTPTVLGANGVSMLINMAIGPLIVVVSLYVQDVEGFSPLGAGLAILPLALATSLSSSRADAVIRYIGIRWTVVVGLTVFAVGLVWLSRISGGAYLVEVFGPVLLIGAGGGVVYVSFTVTATANVDERYVGLAGGLLGTAHQIGSATGLAVLSATAAVTSGHARHDVTALTDGYRAALLVAAVPVLIAIVVAARSLPSGLGGRHDVAVAPPEPEPERLG